MAEVYIDILEEIFVRLSVEDLIQCKRVCKSWYLLISNQRFVKFHLLNNNNNAVINKANDYGIGDTRIYTTFCGGRYYLDLPECDLRDYYYNCHIVGSSNGLVCLSRFNTEILVVNPATRELKKLTSPPQVVNQVHCTSTCFGPPDCRCSCYCWGFGYDSSLDDYKVVLGFRQAECKTCFQVLTLKSNIWKSVGHVYYSCENNISDTVSDAIFWNGALHWITRDKQYYNQIISFDLCKEEFKGIPLPYDCFRMLNGLARLGMIKDGRLCCFVASDIWVMKNHNVQEQCWELCESRLLLNQRFDAPNIWIVNKYNVEEQRWERIISVNQCHDFTEANYMFPRFDKISHKGWTGLSAYYSEQLTAPVFVESLISPHGKYGRLRRKRQSLESTWRVKRQRQTLCTPWEP